MKRRKSSNFSDRILAAICILILFVVSFSPPREYQNKYKMEIYIKTPENTEIKVRECEGLSPDVSCGTAYANYFCISRGTYYGRAVTYLDNRILSTSGWSVLPDLCK